ncbi:MAG: TetR/AcrR family transcriptional regulator [Clostridia bacterium]
MARITKDPKERKVEIMDTAEVLFSEKGFRNVAVSDIVKKVGVAQGTFYYYFQSKEDLLSQTLERQLDGITQNMSLIAEKSELDAQEKLQSILKLALLSGLGKQNMTEHMNNAQDNEMHNKLQEKFHGKLYPVLLYVVEQGIKEGHFVVDSYKEVTQILLFGIQGYMHAIYPYLKDRETVNEKMKAIEEVITKVLGLKKGSIHLSI